MKAWLWQILPENIADLKEDFQKKAPTSAKEENIHPKKQKIKISTFRGAKNLMFCSKIP